MLRAWSRAARIRGYSTVAASTDSVNVSEPVKSAVNAKTASKTGSGSAQKQRELLLALAKKGDTTASELESALAANQQLLKEGKTDPQCAARLSLLFINAGQPERAIEPWVRMLESLSTKTNRLDAVVKKPAFLPAATAALAAYVLASGDASSTAEKQFDPATALKLVIRTDVPSNVVGSLAQYGGIQSAESRQLVREAMAKLRGYATNNYTSQEYLDQIADASFRNVQMLWEDVERTGSTDELSEAVYAAFIRRFAESRQVDMAFTVWNKLVAVHGDAVSATGWAALLRAASLASANSLDLVNGVWQRMLAAKVEPDSQCYDVKIQSLTRNRKFEEAFKLFNELRTSKPEVVDMYVVNNALVSVSEGLRDFAAVDDILAFVAASETLEPTPHTFNIVIKAAQRAKKPQLVAKYLASMEKFDLLPDVVTYTHVVSQLLRRGLPIDNVLAEMKQRNIKPNEHLLTTLAHGMGRTQNNVAYGREIFRLMERSPQMRLNVETFGAIIDLELRLAGSEGVDNAVRYLGLMRVHDLPPNVPTHNQVIRGAVDAKRFDVGHALFNDMNSGKRARLAPNTHTYMFLLSEAVASEARSGNPAARALLEDVLAALAHAPKLLDYALAGSVERIAASIPELVPASLVEAARQAVLIKFDARKQPK